jgi:hypothetical protein
MRKMLETPQVALALSPAVLWWVGGVVYAAVGLILARRFWQNHAKDYDHNNHPGAFFGILGTLFFWPVMGLVWFAIWFILHEPAQPKNKEKP